MRLAPPGPAPAASAEQVKALLALRAAGWSRRRVAAAVFGNPNAHRRVARAERRFRLWVWPWQASDEELDELMEQALTRADEMAAEGEAADAELRRRFG
jgi:hypothetical protein